MKRAAFPALLLNLALGMTLGACDPQIIAKDGGHQPRHPDQTAQNMQKRDPLKWPFAANSIWNMPIGSGAIYVPANLSATPGNDNWAPMPQVDDEIIILEPNAPMTPIYISDAGWTGKNRCQPTGGILMEAPIPPDFVVPHTRANNSTVFLAPDGHTLLQTQPLVRCSAGGPATSKVKFDPVDIRGDGTHGAHGGSKLSSFGGSIRLGELRPGNQGPRHALKVDVYAKQHLYRCKIKSTCYRWPATVADGYAVGHYGIGHAASDEHKKSNDAEQEHSILGPDISMRMGALLAIPASISIAGLGLETEPAKMLAWTLQNYGAYIVDDTYGTSFALTAETGPHGSVREQFKKDWGYDLEQRVRHNTPWVRDMQRLVTALAVVDNNGPNSIGGGGRPRQPLAPPFK